MRAMQRFSFFLFSALAGLFLLFSSSCNKLYKRNLLRGKGNTQTEILQINGAKHLSVYNGIEVEIIQGDQESIKIQAPENILPFVEVLQEGEMLQLYLNPENRYIDADVKAIVTVQTLSGIHLSGGSDVYMRGNFSSPRFEALLSGGSELKNFNLEASYCRLQLSGGSEISGYIKAPKLSLNLSGASEISISASQTDYLNANLSGASELKINGGGLLREAQIDLSGASTFKAENLQTSKGIYSLTGASEAKIMVLDSIDYTLSGASSMYVVGNPRIINQSISGSSVVNFKTR